MRHTIFLYNVFSCLIMALTITSTYAELKWWNHELELNQENEINLRWNNLDSEWLILELTTNKINSTFTVDFYKDRFQKVQADTIHIHFDDKNDILFVDTYANFNPDIKDDQIGIIDASQDFKMLKSELNGNLKAMKFRRRWNTGDENNTQIDENNAYLKWWFRDTSVGNKVLPVINGSETINFKQNSINYRNVLQEPPPGAKVWELVSNNTLSASARTTYMCKIIKFPENDVQKMIGFTPIIQPGNKRRVHHMLFFQCPKRNPGQKHVLEEYLNTNAVNCFSNDMPDIWWENCKPVAMTWTIGSKGLLFPENSGIIIEKNSYFMWQVHYDNEAHVNFTDQSGMKIFYKKDESDGLDPGAAFFSVAHRISVFHLIPPRAESYKDTAFCSSDCTSTVFPKDGITISSVLLHGHSSTTKLSLRHIRNGIELEPIAEELNYDPSYQEYKTLSTPRKFYPGDELLIECTHNTTDRNHITLGGIGANSEMCAAFLYYSPKSFNISICSSQPEFYSFFNTFNIRNVTGDILNIGNLPYNPILTIDQLDDTIIMRNITNSIDLWDAAEQMHVYPSNVEEFQDDGSKITLRKYFEEFNWNNLSPEKLQQQIYNEGKHYAFCSSIPIQNYITYNPASKVSKQNTL